MLKCAQEAAISIKSTITVPFFYETCVFTKLTENYCNSIRGNIFFYTLLSIANSVDLFSVYLYKTNKLVLCTVFLLR